MSVRSDCGVCRRCGRVDLAVHLVRVREYTYECASCTGDVAGGGPGP